MTLTESLFSEDTEAKKADLKQAVEAIFSDASMEQKSVLTPDQVAHVVRAAVYCQRYNSRIGKLAIDYLLKYQISAKGRGRDDMRAALKAILATADDVGDTLKQRLLGVR